MPQPTLLNTAIKVANITIKDMSASITIEGSRAFITIKPLVYVKKEFTTEEKAILFDANGKIKDAKTIASGGIVTGSYESTGDEDTSIIVE